MISIEEDTLLLQKGLIAWRARWVHGKNLREDQILQAQRLSLLENYVFRDQEVTRCRRNATPNILYLEFNSILSDCPNSFKRFSSSSSQPVKIGLLIYWCEDQFF